MRPIDRDGSSEWFILSAVVIRADRLSDTIHKVRAIRGRLSRVIRPDIHFRFLRDENKALVCREIAGMPLRCFVVISNKKNMRGHSNPRAAKVFGRNHFYNWMARLLLERVTRFCRLRSQTDYGEVRKVSLEFSHRGGHSYGQTAAYLAYLRHQSSAGKLFLKAGNLQWPVVDFNNIRSFDPKQRAGLQLADCVASAFHDAAFLRDDGTCKPEFAKLLQERIWGPKKRFLNNGIKYAPWNLRDANLHPAQREIFEFYGYDLEGW